MSKFLKVLFSLFFLVLAFGFVKASVVDARVIYKVKAPVASPTPTPTVAPVSSFDLFWPMVAGKTMESKVYFLKTAKENLRGLLIFGAPQKADYGVFLSVKRVLEAELLINSSKNDLAIKTLDRANDLLTKASSEITSDTPKPVEYETIKNRLDNLIKLVDSLSLKTDGDVKSKLGETHNLIVTLLEKLK